MKKRMAALSLVLMLPACASEENTLQFFKLGEFKEAQKVEDKPLPVFDKKPVTADKPIPFIRAAHTLPQQNQMKKLPPKEEKKQEGEQKRSLGEIMKEKKDLENGQSQASEKPTLIADSLKSAKNAARHEPSKDGYINAIQVYPYSQGALYKVYSAVNSVSDIALEPGEKLISVSAGDTVRWVVANTTSGQGQNEQTHILVKPIAADLETNLVINTNKRSYFVELESTKDAYMSSISWTYPGDSILTLQGDRDALNTNEAIPLDRANYRYELFGDASWKPTQVFDDGWKVYIQFPATLSRGEAPPLFVTNKDEDKPELVNYRVKGNYYIVDRLFDEAELRLGKEPQTIVRINRKDRKSIAAKENGYEWPFAQ